jgi:hypothetical protein
VVDVEQHGREPFRIRHHLLQVEAHAGHRHALFIHVIGKALITATTLPTPPKAAFII